jgi:uncharacterized repeat protein (TIGR01451 family)
LTYTGDARNGEVEDYMVTIDYLADLHITKTDSPDPIVVGNLLTYSITVSNSGPSDAPGVQLTDAIPAGIGNAEYSTDNGVNWAAWSGSLAMGTLPAGSPVTVLIRGQVSCSVAGGSILTNTAVVSTTITESNYANNEASVTTTVQDLDPGVINGPNEFCFGDTGLTFTVAEVSGATGFSWVVPPGSIITEGQGTRTIKMIAGGSAGNGSVCVTVTNGICFSTQECKPVLLKIVNPRPVFE